MVLKKPSIRMTTSWIWRPSHYTKRNMKSLGIGNGRNLWQWKNTHEWTNTKQPFMQLPYTDIENKNHYYLVIQCSVEGEVVIKGAHGETWWSRPLPIKHFKCFHLIIAPIKTNWLAKKLLLSTQYEHKDNVITLSEKGLPMKIKL